jgi:hypothetical protein
VAANSRKGRLIVVACGRQCWDHLEATCREALNEIERSADSPPEHVSVSDKALVEAFLTSSNRAPTEVSAVIDTALLMVCAAWEAEDVAYAQAEEAAAAAQADLVREIFGNPFRAVAFDPAWRTSTAVELARQMYESRDFANMPILADALQDAGCENEDVLTHCRGPGPHARGCWVVDLVLGKS